MVGGKANKFVSTDFEDESQNIYKIGILANKGLSSYIRFYWKLERVSRFPSFLLPLPNNFGISTLSITGSYAP